jgi:hypothetical protein
MIELVFTVCLLASPVSCRDERANLASDSLYSCMTQGQVFAARWLAEHPAYRLSHWRCEPSSARQEPV